MATVSAIRVVSVADAGVKTAVMPAGGLSAVIVTGAVKLFRAMVTRLVADRPAGIDSAAGVADRLKSGRAVTVIG